MIEVTQLVNLIMGALRNSNIHCVKYVFFTIVFLFGLYHLFLSITSYMTALLSEEPKTNEDLLIQLNLRQNDSKLIQFAKDNYLNPPSDKDYNLKDPKGDPAKNEKQHLYALKILQNLRNGFFVEAGAFDGEGLSSTLVLERDYGWNGLLVEADPFNFAELRKKNRKAWTSPACLSVEPKAQRVTFSHAFGGSVFSGIDYVVAKMLKDSSMTNKSVMSINTTCLPIFTLLSALNIKTVDYFALDVEGAELKILKTIPFDLLLIKVITIEYNHIKEGEEALTQFMKSKGFIFVRRIYGPAIADLMFAHKTLKNNLRFLNEPMK